MSGLECLKSNGTYINQKMCHTCKIEILGNKWET